MKERLLAVAGAVALIVVAVVARGVIAGDDGGSGGGGGGGRPVVGCSPGVEAVCKALAEAGRIADDPPTFDLGSDGASTGRVGDVAIDAWITWHPAGEIANFDATEGDDGIAVWDEPTAVGRASLAIAATQPLATLGCPDGPPAWSCLATAADAGNIVAAGDTATIDRLVRLHPVVAAAVAEQASDFADVDLTSVRSIVDNAPDPRPFDVDLRTFVTARGTYQLIVGPGEALASRNLDVIRPAGSDASVALAVVPRRGAPTSWIRSSFGSDGVEAAVRAAGAVPGATTLDPTPAAGDLIALRERLTS